MKKHRYPYKFLIYLSYSYAIPIGEPLERQIIEFGWQIKWFSDLEEGRKRLSPKKNALNSIKEVIAYEPDVVLAATNVVPDFISGIKAQIFHGFRTYKRIGKKDIDGHFRIRGFFDLYCTQGPSTSKVFLSLQEKYKHFEVVETGWSKVDPLFIEGSKAEIADKPTIMIASTFTRRLSLAYNEEVYKKIKSLSKEGKYRFVMVLHPKIPVDIREKWKSLNGAFFEFHDTTDLNPLYRQSDILFADTTSAIQEFLLQVKPVVTFNHTFQHDYLLNVTKPDEIEPAFTKALDYPDFLMEKIRLFIKELHPYADGQSSQRVIRACIALLHKEKNFLKNKPLNLIRKFKIRKRLNYYTFKSYNKPYTRPHPKAMEKLTAIVPTGNEVHNIEGVLSSVSFADEILVIDSYSNDGTYEKAKEMATKVIRRKYENSASQKNWIIPQAKHQWILLVDADERVTEELKNEIVNVLMSPPKDLVGYWIGRKNHFMGSPVKYSGWQTDKVVRLFKRDYCKYENKRVHAEIIATGKLGKLKNRLYHNTYISIDRHIEKLNRYAWWQAEDYDKKIGRLTPFHFVFKPAWTFFRHYLLRAGFRDGVVGLTIAYVQSYAVFMRYVKVWLLRRGRN